MTNIPHGPTIRQSFEQLNLSAIHCVSGVPTIAFLEQNDFSQGEVDRVHAALWNQGLATLLVVIANDTLHVYSLSQLPISAFEKKQAAERLVTTFNLVRDALVLRDLILGVESGRFINENQASFKASNRVDQVLLSNLEIAVDRLVSCGMATESAQALLMQVMFIAYLEDKKIIDSNYFVKATGNSKLGSLARLLNDGRVKKFEQLFKLLKQHFNGDLFMAPCSFDNNNMSSSLQAKHIEVLAEFRAGNINSATGQFQFWPYDFRYIPIELLSAVYERFLGYDPVLKRESGAYYTPMFLAELVVEQAWAELSDKQKSTGRYLDPSCGSGVFLVRLFEKMVEQWRTEHNRRPSWTSLLALIKRVHGIDIKKESIRVASFSLYIALLEQARPSEILALMKKGRLLPTLCSETLRATDFFDVSEDDNKYELVIGNPPWVSRRGEHKNAARWCKENQRTMPGKEIAWGFAWKATAHCSKKGVAALLLRATSFLTNHSETSLKARKQWLNNAHLVRIINFADMRFQLFDGGDAPTALMLFTPHDGSDENYRFDYWTPKADLNLKTKRLLTLSSVDQATVPIHLAKEDPLLLKRRMWMQTPDAKLFQYLSALPALGKKLATYKESKKRGVTLKEKWIIGQGFVSAQEHRIVEANYKTYLSTLIPKIPHLQTNMFHAVVMPTVTTDVWHTNIVYRKGFEEGFRAPHILIPQGIEAREGRLRASYCVQDVSFRHSIQSIRFASSDERQAKFLTLLLNSSLTAWFLFHHSSNTAMERDKVHQEQLLDIPFPAPEDMDNPELAERAFDDGVRMMDKWLKQRDKLLQADISDKMNEIDKVIYRYFCFDESDISIIEDTLRHIIPSMQPRANAKEIPELWKNTTERDWRCYGERLSAALTQWMDASTRAITELAGFSADLAVIGVRLTQDASEPLFQNQPIEDMNALLTRIWKALPSGLPGNFQLVPDLRVFIDDVLYLVKPRKKRFWLNSTALADADAIAGELLMQQTRKQPS